MGEGEGEGEEGDGEGVKDLIALRAASRRSTNSRKSENVNATTSTMKSIKRKKEVVPTAYRIQAVEIQTTQKQHPQFILQEKFYSRPW